MKKIKLLIATFVLISTASYAQSIKGKLLDLVDNKPLSGASVTLTGLKDSTQKFSSISDNNGSFEFKNLSRDSFTLRVSFIGYEDFKQIVGVKDSAVDLGTLFIPKSVKSLTGVTVVAQTPPTSQKGDTIQYNASQFKVNPDANAEDMIKKVPGVTVDRQGNVTAQGEQIKKVTIDGRDFFGDDATAALRNLPAEIIDKIQVFDKLSDQAQFTGFDDGNTQKALNIVTKAGMRNGQFGRLYAGYGTDNHYLAGGNVSFFKQNRRISLVGISNDVNQQNFSTQDLLGVTSSGQGGNRGGFGGFNGGQGNNRGGGQQGGNRGGNSGGGQGNFLIGQQNGISKTNALGVNYSDLWGKKLTVSGSYFFNNSNNNNEQFDHLEFFDQFTHRTKSISFDSSFSSSKNYNNRVNLRLEYKIDSSNSILFTPSLNFQNNKSVSSSHEIVTNGEGDFLSSNESNIDSKTTGYNIGNNLLFRHSFAKRGRTISVGLNTSLNQKTGNIFIIGNSQSEDSIGNITTVPQNQFTNNLTKGHTLSTNIAYTEPLGKRGQLQFNYNPSFTKNNADQEVFNFDPSSEKYSVFIDSLSNIFENTYVTHNGGVSYRVGDRDKQFSIGINYQHSKLTSEQKFPKSATVQRSFSNFLPNLQWRKKLSARSSVNFFLRANVNAPSVTQLQNVLNVNNPLLISTGNPDLKQQYNASLVARYTFTNTQKGQSFFANFFVQQTSNYISNALYTDSLLVTAISLPRGGRFTFPVNLDGYWSVRSFLTYGQLVKLIKSNINFNAGLTYSRLPGLIDNVKTITNNYVYNAGTVIASNVSEFVDFNISYNASINTIKEQPDNNQLTQNLGVQFNLLSKKGWFVQNDLNNQSYNYRSTSIPDQSFWLWNAAIGKKFLKDQAGELKLSVFDLLKQNKSVQRTVNEVSVEDVQSTVLQRYFMLTFSYRLKNFGVAKTNNRPSNNPRRNF
jgi:hypothetical protein